MLWLTQVPIQLYDKARRAVFRLELIEKQIGEFIVCIDKLFLRDVERAVKILHRLGVVAAIRVIFGAGLLYYHKVVGIPLIIAVGENRADNILRRLQDLCRKPPREMRQL